MTLKQTTASLIFEAIDDALDRRSPLKAEPNYLNKQPLLGEPPTRPKRVSELFPFWPRPRGSLAPDLVIVEYRQQPFHVANVFAAVEIKFPRDWVKADQLKSYVELMGSDRKKVALLRVPEDCVGYQPGEGNDAKQSGRTGGKGRK
ncbi:VRR-NUC domain-containing protein [Pseudomonas aeruginosa]|nr:VRR-NUC domain-containing protein [Pseudomonas aeruginosa]